MNYQIVLSPGADADIISVVRWYLNIDPNLALRFLGENTNMLLRITRMPYAFPLWADASRRAVLDRFPYSIYYSVEMNIVTVDAVIHHRRSNAVWLRRRHGHRE
jgi:plasmid stabilization system protein ParE